MVHLIKQSSEILDFLAAPIAFSDIVEKDKNVRLAAFVRQYATFKTVLEKPVPRTARKLLDSNYFATWTGAFTKHMLKAFTKDGKKLPPAMEFFGSDIEVEEEAYTRKLKGFWTEVIEHAESELTIIATLSKNAAMVKQSMPAKLRALQAGMFEALHPNLLFKFFPIPNKAFLNSLHRQTGAITDAIHEVSYITHHLQYDSCDRF